MKNKGMGRKGTESDRARNVAEQTLGYKKR